VNSLKLTGVSPGSGSAGTSVTLSGTGFGATQGSGTVTLGSIAGQVVSWSDTQVVATVATGSLSGIARVQQGGVLSNALSFIVPPSGGGTVSKLVPTVSNMVVGETRTLQALNSSGQTVTGLTWTSSDSTIVSLSTDNPPVLSALAAGHVTITAGSATADVTVYATALPLGTTIWSNPGNGSGVSSIVPAVPSATGVADVFAFQNDGTVQAITSDGTVAWTADVSNAVATPDFQGGLVLSSYDGSKIVKLDGLTGQPYPAFTFPVSGYPKPVVVHTDGTIFTFGTTAATAVMGIDPITGTQKFGVPRANSGANGSAGGLFIAGDGYAYTLYERIDGCGDNCVNHHVYLLRVNSDGASDDIHLMDWQGKVHDIYAMPGGMITNADTGIVFTLQTDDIGSYIITTTGTSVSIANAQRLPSQAFYEPVLQMQDGSFVGTATDADGNLSMVAFDATGAIRWSVPGEMPKIATADGGVIAESGVAFGPGGVASKVMQILPTFSWLGNAYQIGSVDQISIPLLFLAQSWWAYQGGNNSGNGTGYYSPAYRPLPSCTDNYGGPCQGERQAGDFLWNAKQDLVRQLMTSTGCAQAATAKVLSKFRDTKGNILSVSTFTHYLNDHPGFFDGSRSTLRLKEVKCGPGSGLNCSGYGTVADYFADTGEATAITFTPRTPFGSYWQPNFKAAPRRQDGQLVEPQFEGFGIGIDPSNNGVNVFNESVLVHEALHGMTGIYDDSSSTTDLYYILTGMNASPSIFVSIYVKNNFLNACPSFQ
jgi:hypothetical protein